jgi:hypothetical protein
MPLCHLTSALLPLDCLSAPLSPPSHRPADLAPDLRAVLAALPDPRTAGTAAGRRLRRDVERHLEDLAHGGRRDLRGFPSAAQVREWLERARFDLAINPGALYRLHYAARDFEKQWKLFELPSDDPLHRRFQTLDKEITDGIRFPKKHRTDIRQLMAFDARLEDLKAETREFVAYRDAGIARAVEAHQRANAALRSVRPPGAPSPAPG